MDMRKVVESLPNPMEQAIRKVYWKVKYGKVFQQMLDFLQESQWWSKPEIEEYQMQRLSGLLKHAYENIPHYRRTFDEAGVKPNDIQTLDDMKKLPLIEKEDMRDNLQEFLAPNYKKSQLSYVTTGGSTGIPFGFYQLRGYTGTIESAFLLTQWSRVGYEKGDKSAEIRGSYIGDSERGEYWRYASKKRLLLSSYHLTADNIPKYIEEIRKFEPDFIKAYPSAIAIMARQILESKIDKIPEVKAILAGSENLYPSQRELVEQVFKCRVFSWYGHAEMIVLAAECEHSNEYHIFPEYGYTELLDANGNQVTKEGELGEIVGTGFHNMAMPMIRYKTRDLAVLGKERCSECGRDYQLLSRIEGRLQELLVTKNGRLISMTAINMHSDVFDNVKQFQFYQDTKGEAVFNIVKKPTYTDADTQNIQRELGKKLRDDVGLTIKFVNDIPRTRSGKYRFLIQKLPIELSD